jgi:Flp pilus assembly pilin Flp
MLNLKRLAAKLRRSQNEKGQGLVEYALILVLVAIVVIAVLLVLGPIVGNVFSNVVTNLSIPGVETAAPASEPTPTPASWTYCADEGGNCSFSGTKEVRYGANSTYNYGTHTNGVACSNTVFGDPIGGVPKKCYYR